MQIQRPERKATRESNPHIYNFSAVSTVLTEYSIQFNSMVRKLIIIIHNFITSNFEQKTNENKVNSRLKSLLTRVYDFRKDNVLLSMITFLHMNSKLFFKKLKFGKPVA